MSRVLDRYYKAALTKYSTTQHITAILSKMAIPVLERKTYDSAEFDEVIDQLRKTHAVENNTCGHYTCVFPAGSSLVWWEKVGFG